jgi:hypothetical protein
LLALYIQRRQRVHWLTLSEGMVLAHTDDAASSLIYDAIGVAVTCLGRDRVWLTVVLSALAIETLIQKVGKENGIISDQKVTATVFMHPRANVKEGWCDIGHHPIGRPTHDDGPPSLRRTTLRPIGILAMQDDLPDPDSARYNQVRRNRRLPGTIRHD